MDIRSGGGAIIIFSLAIAGIVTFWEDQFTDESIPQVKQWRGRQVMNAGEFLYFSATGALDGMVSGYLLRADMP